MVKIISIILVGLVSSSYAKEEKIKKCLPDTELYYEYLEFTKGQTKKKAFSLLDEKVSKGASNFGNIFLKSVEKSKIDFLEVIFKGKTKSFSKKFKVSKNKVKGLAEVEGYHYKGFLNAYGEFPGILKFRFKSSHKTICQWEQKLSDFEPGYDYQIDSSAQRVELTPESKK